MRERSCCFTGHRRLPQKQLPVIRQRLQSEVIRLIEEEGVRDFYAGGALGFDTLAAETVLRCREAYPFIRLSLVLPCADQAKDWSGEAVARYEAVKERADAVVCLSERYYTGCMQARNRYLADHSGWCLAYMTRARGGTAYTVAYCRAHGVRVIQLAAAEKGADEFPLYRID